ncbi:MAG TPA: ATP phosphoribosyltransferase [Nitrolancea sp.]|nr:ATP phosphoribosyltransferase [Nitrolancea sp.]
MSDMLRLALSSKGGYEEATARFLENSGISMSRPNPRQYVGRLSGMPDVEVLFQRTEDIVHKVAEGSADLGITGLDLVTENGMDEPNLVVVMDDLGFRRCELVIAVPEGWLDITSVSDLADLSIDLKRTGRTLRVATKFPNLTRDFLYQHGINYFTVVDAHGALEAAPVLGYADIITDLSETGVTLRDNRLRVLNGGVILRAQACMIAARRAFREHPEKLQIARPIIELAEARLRTRDVRLVTANVRGESPEAVARHVTGQLETAGQAGPTISSVFPKNGTNPDGWFAVTIIVPADRLLAAVDHLRLGGSSGITVTSPDYVFDGRSCAFERLVEAVKGK